MAHAPVDFGSSVGLLFVPVAKPTGHQLAIQRRVAIQGSWCCWYLFVVVGGRQLVDFVLHGSAADGPVASLLAVSAEVHHSLIPGSWSSSNNHRHVACWELV